MSRFRFYSAITAMTLVVGACGGGEPEPPPPPATLEEAMTQATEAIQNANPNSTEPIPAADLASHIPDELAGMTAENRSHQDVGAMGMKMSMATAEYRDGNQRIDVSITDAGSVGQMAPMAAAWAMVDFDRTTSSGYEKTIRFEGNKGVESVSRDGGRLRSELSFIVGGRVIVKLEGREIEIDQLKDAAKALDLKALARGK